MVLGSEALCCHPERDERQRGDEGSTRSDWLLPAQQQKIASRWFLDCAAKNAAPLGMTRLKPITKINPLPDEKIDTLLVVGRGSFYSLSLNRERLPFHFPLPDQGP